MQTRHGAQYRMEWTNALAQEARTLVAELDMNPAARRLFDGSIDTDSYIHYLVQTYHYVRWTTPLLAETGERLQRSGQHRQLGNLFMQKAREEHGHERWLLQDLKNLGWPAERVEAVEPCAAVSAYAAWNRYTARRGNPLAFLGTAFVLEYLSVQRAGPSVERLLAAGRIPNIDKAVSFIRGHGLADGDHVAELTALLGSLTDGEDQAALLLSARTTRVLYLGMFSTAEQGPQQINPS